jgi:endonuclease-3
VKDQDIDAAMECLRQATLEWTMPYVTALALRSHNPFRVLISTMLSLRTKDAVTAEASRRLFALADTPRAMVKLTPRQIEKPSTRPAFIARKQKIFCLSARN